jgi:hypothetical protein
MARTKQTPKQSKYFLSPLYRHANNDIDRNKHLCTPNYVPSLARRYYVYEARKATWEAKHPDTPYPHSRPEADNYRGAATHR